MCESVYPPSILPSLKRLPMELVAPLNGSSLPLIYFHRIFLAIISTNNIMVISNLSQDLYFQTYS